MEQHPIPQDVTGFQFKLIGSMTVKQFGYVAGGAIFAVICWYAPVQGILWQIIVKGLLMPIFGLSGVIIAFVPIEGRPVDVMAANFFHAIFSPNQYIYIKRGRKFSFNQVSLPKQNTQKIQTQSSLSKSELKIESKKEQQLRALLSSSYKSAHSSLDRKESAFLESIYALPSPVSVIAQHAQPTVSRPTNSQMSQSPLAAPGSKTFSPQPNKPNPSQASTPVRNVIPQAKTATLQPNPVSVRNMDPEQALPAGFSHLPEAPNIVMGIVKDPRGNILPGIIVEIKDKEGNPVRAFKTNLLGQFASATQLQNGNYAIELEDPKKQHSFDIIQITASGQIIIPIEIISHDAREELHQALFN